MPNFTRGNARADDLVRNNGYAANAIQLHQDHIVGSFFRLSHRPSWRYLGIGEEEARAFSREVEAAWKEFAEDDCCCIDVERKRTFTMMIREGVAMHAFNGELFVQATWDTSPSRLFRTQFRMVSPKRISNPNNTGDSRNCRAGVQINDSGAALGYYVSEDGYPGWMPQKWTWIPRELPGGRASFIHVFEPVEDGQTRGANVFYSVMEQMKMLDTLQNTQLQSAIVKAMYAATIESELDTQSAMDFILGANSQEQRERLTGWIGEIAAYYAAAPVRLGGAKVPYMGTSATMTSGEQSGAVIRGVFDDPENISYAGQGVRVEGSSPSLFVRTDDVRQLRRGDTLTIGEENFWIDRISPDDGGSCHLWLGRGVPPAVNRRR